jgi:hypothetical protein
LSIDQGKLDKEQMYALCHRLQRETQLLPDAALRRRLDDLTTVIWHMDAVAFSLRLYLSQLSFILYRATIDLTGAFLRRDPLPTAENSRFIRDLDLYVKEAKAHEAYVEHELAEQEKGPSPEQRSSE